MKRLVALPFLLLSGATLATPAPAVPATVAPQQQDLKEIRQQINSLQKDIKAKESDRAEASSAARQSEVAISETTRVLNSLEQKQQLSERELARVRNEIALTRRHIDQTRTRISKVLNSQYRSGKHDAMQMLLNQQDPNRAARDLHYYTYIAKAQQSQFTQLRTQLGELERLSEQLDRETAQLDQLAAERQQQRSKLERENQNHRQLVSRLSNEIHTKQGQVDKLREDEKRLTELIATIQRQIEARRREEARKRAEAKKKAEQAARAAQREAQRRAEEAKKAGKPAPRPEPVRPAPVESVDETADASASGKAFASLQGKLRLPAAGELIGRFGAPRPEGTSWRGVYIKAPAGQAVRAVADGRVVYADRLRGFGNMLIIDHGGTYMTVYGGGDTLNKTMGAMVKAGDTVATTGNSGNMEHPGLYFEIRHLGRPVNPLSWAR